MPNLVSSAVENILSGDKSQINFNKSLFQSGYVGMLIPIDFVDVVPGDEVKLNNSYEVNLARCTGLVRNNLKVDFQVWYIPDYQILTSYESYLWNDAGLASDMPKYDIDLADNNDATKVDYYMLPEHGSGLIQYVDARPLRRYQKIWFDKFAEPFIKLGGSSSSGSYYSTATGNDAATSHALRGTPVDNEYFNKLVASIDSSGTISAPFSLATLATQIIKERTTQLKKRYSARNRDLIMRLFNTKSDRTDMVKLVASHSFMLNEMKVLNTSATNTGSEVSKFTGYNNNNSIDTYIGAEFGCLVTTAVVRPIDTCLTRNVSLYLDADFNSDAYGYYRPEAQGLAYKQLKVKHFDISTGTPTDAIGAENLYDHIRYQINEAKGAFSRPDGLEKQMVSLKGSTLLDYSYYNTNHFTDLFAESPQVTFNVRTGGHINRCIKKNLEIVSL